MKVTFIVKKEAKRHDIDSKATIYVRSGSRRIKTNFPTTIGRVSTQTQII